MSQFTGGFTIIQDVIKLKWIPEILDEIEKGENSFSRILENTPYLSSMELTRKLKVLQERDIVIKDDAGLYAMTTFGDDILHILRHLKELNDRYSQLVS